METREQFELRLKTALNVDLPYEDRIQQYLPGQAKKLAKPAAVLILFAHSRSANTQDTSVLFTRRTESVETHKGQMAFPGGHCELQDPDEASTALRETEEEMGISKENVQVLGRLPSLWTVTGYLIQPIVGISKQYLEEISMTLNPSEIAEAVWVPLSVLLSPETYRREAISVGPIQYPIDVYQVEKHRIWGATGAMTKNLLDRLASAK